MRYHLHVSGNKYRFTVTQAPVPNYQFFPVDNVCCRFSCLLKIRIKFLHDSFFCFCLRFIHIVVVCHITLSFYESTKRPDAPKKSINLGPIKYNYGISSNIKFVLPEVVCLLFELFDVSMRLSWMRLCKFHVLRPKHEKRYGYLQLAIVVYIAFDLVLNLLCQVSLEYLIPVRPILLIIINPTLRSELATLIKSIRDIAPVLGVYAMVVLVCGIFAQNLFGFRYKEMVNGEPSEFEGKFLFVLRSSLTMFVFVSSGENYTDLVYPGIDKYRTAAVLLFFVPIIFAFYMMAMITGIFEDVYTQRETDNRRRQRWWKRVGSIAAFQLIDSNNDGCLQLGEFLEFVSYFRETVDRNKLEELFHSLDSDNSGTLLAIYFYISSTTRFAHALVYYTGAIDLDEFVTGIEQLTLSRLFKDPKSLKATEYSWWASVQRFILSDTAHKLRVLVLVLNFWCCSWINIVDNRSINQLLFALVLLHTVDVLLNVAAMKPHRYWLLTDYLDHYGVEQLGNRLDAVIVGTSFVGTILCVSKLGFDDPATHSWAWLRVFPVLVLLRCFVVWDVSLRFMFMIKAALLSLVSLLVIMFAVFFVYGVIGVSMFGDNEAGWNNAVGEDSYMFETKGIPRGNFMNLGNAMLLLTQAYVGEAFHEIMHATKDSVKSDDWMVCLYMVSYFILMTLLFANLFFGLLLSVFSSLYDIHKSGRRLTTTEIRKATQLDDNFDQSDGGEIKNDEGGDVIRSLPHLVKADGHAIWPSQYSESNRSPCVPDKSIQSSELCAASTVTDDDRVAAVAIESVSHNAEL